MAIQIQENFAVQAPPERVWSYLTDPQRVVQCLPGAELLEAEDERTFVGRVKVKIGPVTAAYRGRAQFVELDEANRRVGLVGEGQETGGSGTARMTMSSEIVPLPEGGSEVRVTVDIEVAGKIVQFGRGMIEQVSRQLFRQFSACAQATLAQEDAPAAAGSAADVPPAPAAAGAAAPAPGGHSPAKGGGNPPAVGTQAVALPAANAPVNGLRLVLIALGELIRGVLGGKK